MHWEGPQALTPGKHTIEFDFKYDGLGFATLAFNDMSGIGRGGTGVLKIDETFDVGSDTGTPVDDEDYQVPFPFTGKIDNLTISVEPPKLTPEDEKKLRDAYRAAQDANQKGANVASRSDGRSTDRKTGNVRKSAVRISDAGAVR
ncbi:hypothetical protein HYPP_03489 [Hyphomicrobium sp. ghe19]|nr:hypothetical protein HYPP_03489 [Hyphomicrobium sp. ghe19]